METVETVNTLKTILDLGVSGLLLYFLYTVWNDRKVTIKEKDDRITKLSDKVIEIVEQNTKTQEALRGAINENTKATGESVRATENLTTRVYDALKRS